MKKFISNDPHIVVSNLRIKLILDGFFQIYGSNIIMKLISNGLLASRLCQQCSNYLFPFYVRNVLMKLILNGLFHFYVCNRLTKLTLNSFRHI